MSNSFRLFFDDLAEFGYIRNSTAAQILEDERLQNNYVLSAPNATLWQIKVSNSGVISTTPPSGNNPIPNSFRLFFNAIIAERFIKPGTADAILQAEADRNNFVIYSPNGTRFNIVCDGSGNLSAAPIAGVIYQDTFDSPILNPFWTLSESIPSLFSSGENLNTEIDGAIPNTLRISGIGVVPAGFTSKGIVHNTSPVSIIGIQKIKTNINVSNTVPSPNSFSVFAFLTFSPSAPIDGVAVLLFNQSPNIAILTFSGGIPTTDFFVSGNNALVEIVFNSITKTFQIFVDSVLKLITPIIAGFPLSGVPYIVLVGETTAMGNQVDARFNNFVYSQI